MHYVKGASRLITTTRIASTLFHHGRQRNRGIRGRTRDVGPGDLVFIPPEEKHRLRASKSPLFYFEFQAPNRFITKILDGTKADLVWNRVEGGVWVQT